MCIGTRSVGLGTRHRDWSCALVWGLELCTIIGLGTTSHSLPPLVASLTCASKFCGCQVENGPTCIHTLGPICIHTLGPICIHTLGPICIHTLGPTCIHTLGPTCIHTLRAYMYTHLGLHVYTLGPTCIHTWAYMYTHTEGLHVYTH